MDLVELSDEAERASDAGQYAEAARLYRQVIELIPLDDIEGRIIYHMLAAGAHVDARKYDEAIDDCRCAISLNPNDMSLNPNAAIVWRSLGRTLLDAGQLTEAKCAFEKSLALGAT